MRNCWSRLLLRETQDAANNQVGVLTLIFIYSQTLMPGLPNLFLLMITVIFLFLLICLRGSCVAQATLKLGMQPRITFHSSEYSASHSGITGMCCHAWGVQFCRWNPGLMHIRQVSANWSSSPVQLSLLNIYLFFKMLIPSYIVYWSYPSLTLSLQLPLGRPNPSPSHLLTPFPFSF